MAQVALSEELQEEIQTLKDVYSADELTITITTILQISYHANINDNIKLIIVFDIIINENAEEENNATIKVSNSNKATTNISKDILTKIESILYEKYKEEQDCMPVFQCISYCSGELPDDEEIFSQFQSKDNENDPPKSKQEELEQKNIDEDELKLPELAVNEGTKRYLAKPNKIRTRIGIVGLPNIGKSSFFNLISSKKVPAENYPFCTIKPSQAQVEVPCDGFNDLCKIMDIKRKKNGNDNPVTHIGAALTIYDIAGLVRGAHKGDGLGNEFLSNIQSVGAIYHMVRAFDVPKKKKHKKKNGHDHDEIANIQHVEGSVDPIRDLNIITHELRQKDLMVMNNKLLALMRKLKHQNMALNSELKSEYELVDKIVKLLQKGLDIGCESSWTEKDIEYIHSYNLFSCKPVVFLVNVSEKDWQNGNGKGMNKWIPNIKEWVDKYYPGSKVIDFCAAYEKKQRDLNDRLWKENTIVNDIIYAGYQSLELIHFYTINDNDGIKCWTIRKGMRAPRAARKINIEIEKNFIGVDTYSYHDFKKYDYDVAKVKSAGKWKQNGKNYVVQHEDILYFKWNKGSKKGKK